MASVAVPGASALCASERRARAHARALLRGSSESTTRALRAAFLLDTCASIIDRAQRGYYHTTALCDASARYYRAVDAATLYLHASRLSRVVDELSACTALGSMLVAADALCCLASMATRETIGPLLAGMRAVLRMVTVRNGLPVNPASGKYIPFTCVPTCTVADHVVSATDVASVQDRVLARQFAIQYVLRARWCNQRCDWSVVGLAEGFPEWPSLYAIRVTAPDATTRGGFGTPPPDDADSGYSTASHDWSPLLGVSFIGPSCTAST